MYQYHLEDLAAIFSLLDYDELLLTSRGKAIRLFIVVKVCFYQFTLCVI
jgi:hypothetical protein